MEFQQFIKTELVVLIPVMYFIGIGLKKSKMPDKWIPMVLGVISIILCVVWIISSEEIAGIKELTYVVFMAVTQGVLIAGASVYVNQLYVQARKEE